MPGVVKGDEKSSATWVKDSGKKPLLTGITKWIVYVSGGGMGILILAWIVIILTAAPPESIVVPVETPSLQTYQFNMTFSIIEAPYAHGQRIVKIEHSGGEEVYNISTISFGMYPPDTLNYPKGVVAAIDPKAMRMSFREGDVLYIILTKSKTFYVSRELPKYNDFIDLTNGDWRITLLDNRPELIGTKIQTYVTSITNSMTRDAYDYASIRNALISSNPYDTIYVNGSVYEERLKIEQPVRLISTNRSVLDGGNLNAIIEVHSGDVEITGFELRYSGNKVFTDGGIVIYPKLQNIIIRNMNIHHCAVGVWLWDSSNNIIEFNEIHTNDKDGILLQNNADGNIIRYNNLYINGLNGINVEGGDYNTITDNVANDNTNYGIIIIGYETLHNICEYNDGTGNEFRCSDTAERGPREPPSTPVVYSSEDNKQIIWTDGPGPEK
jgi:parallel beta-helix repeat protein